MTIREPEVFGFAAGEETKEQQRRIMAYINQFQYYETGEQILKELITPTSTFPYDIVNNFMLLLRQPQPCQQRKVQGLFHAKRAIQELNYDALVIKVLQLTITDQ